jgi:DNA modification methylase
VSERGRKRANDLDGRTWTRYSISIWSDLRKSPEEMALRHPAMFPASLAERLIDCFTTAEDRVVLDPFAGIGSTVVAAASRGKLGIGIELSEEFVSKARGRLEGGPATVDAPAMHCDDASRLLEYVAPGSVDLVVTSPPYWDILLKKRTADFKAIRHYGETTGDLGKISDYPRFLDSLEQVFRAVHTALRPGAYCCVVVMDVRKKATLFPLHSDLASRLQAISFRYDDLIIWDRRHEYNQMRPLGYPAVFRINKAHEFILIFQKPR